MIARYLACVAIAAAGLVLPGCSEEIPPYEALPPTEEAPAAIVVGAAVRAKGRIPGAKHGAQFGCELAATDSVLRLRLKIAGTGLFLDSIIDGDGFSVYLPTAGKFVEGSFDGLSPRIRRYLGFARGDYVGLVFPRLLPQPGETCRCLAAGRCIIIEYSDYPRGIGVVKRRLWLDAASGRAVKLQRVCGGRKVFTIEYLDYREDPDDSAQQATPGRLRLRIPHVLSAELVLGKVKLPDGLRRRVVELVPPESAERVRVGTDIGR